MHRVRELPNDTAPANDPEAPTRRRPQETLAPLWRVLAASGYGLWAWLGLALALGLYRIGRNATLIPLSVGILLVGAGLLVACLPGRDAPDWHGWRPTRDSRPTRAALLALATFLPMLAVAGLARGDNTFWATRLAGAMLTLCSLASLSYAAFRYRRQLSPWSRRVATSLPASRLAFAGYAGGLWLWLCALAQAEPDHSPDLYPWVLLLLVFALLLGLLEGMGWQSLYASEAHRGAVREYALRPARFVAALLTYVLPCVALLLSRRTEISLFVAALAVPSCLLGKWMEQRLYESVLATE